ncbi:hypothetical protein JTB14_005412 [Gonioctena quinquepunctata]|nr:hypothetical protein JTB14_005412 [Gonioctena quinquepunctata]
MVISISDFPFICRVCLSRNDLKLFEEEKHLLDLYLRITGIGEEVINSSPDNVCCTCINTLMDILTFIDLAKCNDSILRQCRLLEIDSKIAIKGDLRDNEIKMTSCPPLKDSPTHDSSCVCCVCASSSNLVPFCDPHTLSTFKTITYVGPSSEKEIPNKICDKCVEKLMSISAFIKLSKSNMYLYQELTSQKVSENRYLDKTNVQFKAEIDFPDLKENNHEMDVIENKECLTNESEDWMKVEVKTENFDEENIRMDIIKFKNLHEYLEVKEEYIGDSAKKCSEITVEETEFKLEEGTLSKDEPEYATNEHLQSTGKTYFENEVKPLIVHKHQLVFKCEVCRRNFSTPQNKNNHLSSHFGKNPVTCTICGKWFVGKREYIEHYRVHISKEPKSNISYKIVCPTNIPKSQLNVHLKKHQNDKPFECEVCQKGFFRKCDLKRHMGMHLEEKPFKCDICSRGFSQKDNLKAHMNVHVKKQH